MTEDIGSKVFSGAIWMVALRMSVKFIGLLSTMVLARLLVPEDFGIIAIAMTIYAFLELINAFGFDMVLIQNQHAGKADYDSAWTMQVMFGFIASLLMCLVTFPLAQYYNDERLIEVMFALALLFLINSLKNIGLVDFRKHFQFNKEFKFQLIVKVLSTLITISLAFTLQSYWALVFGMLSSSFISLILSYLMSPYRPSFCFERVQAIFRFSKWLLLNNLLFFMNNRAHDLIIGKIINPQAVGLFSVSNEIATLPTSELIAPINRASYPGYTKVSSDQSALSQLFLNIVSSIAILAIPAGVGVAVLAPILVPIMLGNQWQSAVLLIQIIAVSSVAVSLNTNIGYVYMAINRPKITTVLFTLRLIIYIPILIYFLSLFGVLGAAYASGLVSFIIFPVAVTIACKMIQLRVADYLRTILRPICASGIMYLLLAHLVQLESDYFAIDIQASILYCIAYALLGALIYVISLIGLWWISGKPDSAEKKLVNKMFKLAHGTS
ncbi:lipopolysaccharide biosynthesis protein [Paraglaciecola arctica]|uniref:Uncharacterized protein n=1 Tax=Paraglaciecola arctica BSs20135 TaxID=493475 RepID=K6YPI2_9ALTE|nr:lipopolysaccharide biosynthesis protein [Paraglaciecola arctica]GAC18548.1 hypothetical protein GARC_1576 [Paraglaciecola arctica BSs20135]